MFIGVTNIEIIAPICYTFSDIIDMKKPSILPNKNPPSIKLRKNTPNTSIDPLFKSPNQ